MISISVLIEFSKTVLEELSLWSDWPVCIWLVRVMEVDLNFRGKMSIVEFKSRVEEKEPAREIEEQVGEWSKKATENGGFNKKKLLTKSNAQKMRQKMDHQVWSLGYCCSVIEQSA